VKSRSVAVARFQISRGTIKNKLKGDFNRKPEGPRGYLFDEESVIVEHVKNRQNLFSL
jgi:hypothetical protein